MKIIHPRVHGYLDYAAVVVLALAPTLLGFHGTPAALSYVFAILLGGMSMMTAYPLGPVKIIPFTAHAGAELGAAILFILAPWLFRFSEITSAKNFFLVAGVCLAVARALSDYKSAQRGEFEREARKYRESFI